MAQYVQSLIHSDAGMWRFAVVPHHGPHQTGATFGPENDTKECELLLTHQENTVAMASINTKLWSMDTSPTTLSIQNPIYRGETLR